MLIVAGSATMDASVRDSYVAAHRDLVERCRRAAGCLDVAISADPVDPTRVNVFERWESRKALDEWRAVAHAPDTGVAFDADVQLFVVADVRPPFG